MSSIKDVTTAQRIAELFGASVSEFDNIVLEKDEYFDGSVPQKDTPTMISWLGSKFLTSRALRRCLTVSAVGLVFSKARNRLVHTTPMSAGQPWGPFTGVVVPGE